MDFLYFRVMFSNTAKKEQLKEMKEDRESDVNFGIAQLDAPLRCMY